MTPALHPRRPTLVVFLLLDSGIDELLRRISEGVRLPSRNPAQAPPAAPLATPSERLRPSNISSAPAAEVAIPPSVLSKNTREEARQGSTCGLSTPGCSNIRVGLGVACDGDDEREVRCLSQERTRSITGCGEGYDNGGRGVGGTGERRTASSPVDFSGACCLCEGSEVVGQRPGEAGRVECGEAVGGGGDKDGRPNALNVLVSRGAFKPGLSCSSGVAFASPVKGSPRSGALGGSDDKENRRV